MDDTHCYEPLSDAPPRTQTKDKLGPFRRPRSGRRTNHLDLTNADPRTVYTISGARRCPYLCAYETPEAFARDIQPMFCFRAIDKRGGRAPWPYASCRKESTIPSPRPNAAPAPTAWSDITRR